MNANEEYCLYLRKSRADIDLENQGQGETLARHEKILLDLAHRMQLNITEIYREVVSGETITSRPMVQKLLAEVETGRWAGVLVVEIERLARGDTIDQGIVARAFKYSGTKIITPVKIYEPDNEFDEEYFEFGLFMSRREYHTIRRRLIQGRVAAAKEGKHATGSVPYGYERVPVSTGKGFTLRPIPEQADIIRLIFKLYTEGEESDDGTMRKLGTAAIATKLTKMRVVTPRGGRRWSQRTVGWILENPVYIGKIRWNHKVDRKYVVDGVVRTKRVVSSPEDEIIVSGLHEGIVPKAVFDLAQKISANRCAASVPSNRTLANPLSGIVVCGLCGSPLRYKHTSSNRDSGPSLVCRNSDCPCVGSYLSVIENRLLSALSDWVSSYQLDWAEIPTDGESTLELKQAALSRASIELDKLHSQLDRTYDLLEQGVYDVDKFLERSSALSARINEENESLSILQEEVEKEKKREENRRNIVPNVQRLLSVYQDLPTASAKNAMLHEVLEKVEYVKEKPAKRNGPLDNFELTLYPKLPDN